jgi:hypothetical protein
MTALSSNIFAKPDGGSAPGLTNAIMADRNATAAAEIVTLRQKLAAAAARIQEEMGPRKATEVDKDNALHFRTTDRFRSKRPHLCDIMRCDSGLAATSGS